MRTISSHDSVNTLARLRILLAEDVEVLKRSETESLDVREFDELFDDEGFQSPCYLDLHNTEFAN